MKRLFLTALMVVAVVGCMGKKPEGPVVHQDSAKAQQMKAAAAEAEMERDIASGNLTLTEPQSPAPAEKIMGMPPKKKPMKLGSLKPQTKYPMKNGFPVWFFTPVYDGYIGAVGIAPKGRSITAQKRVAKIQAQKNLAKQIEVLVNTEVKVESLGVDTATVQYYRQKVTSLTKERVDQFLKGFRVQDEWIDEKTGEYYIWMILSR